ncbi:matrixin family metalloprotease [Agromyces aurantiacus]|uniref:Matrixin family metalloprotease n=1 Tax=Agromyces aurantiacus TaxID=165814 RepID=A0ABV9R9U8_9MICO|nr:matrixin family metalloprotease [Agromyces aurantiacus]MBM7503769.1 hypothetical protein [Agromyces aurantiacus]
MSNDETQQLSPLSRSGGTVKFRIMNAPGKQPALSPGDVAQIIATAFARWEAVSNFDFDETSGDDWIISLAFGDLADYAGADWVKANPKAIAITTYGEDLNQAQRRIMFSDGINWNKEAHDAPGTMVNPVLWFITKAIQNSTVQNLAAVAVHEIGHALGLAHNEDTNSIMQSAVSELNGSMLYFLHDQSLQNVDVQALEQLYGNPFAAAPPPESTAGYAIVGSSFAVGHTNSTGFQTLTAAAWGERQGESVALMSGYAWDQARNAKGYALWFGYLRPLDRVGNRWYVVGGGTFLANRSGLNAPIREQDDETSIESIVDYTVTAPWGSQDGIKRLSARSIAWNQGAGHDVDAIMYLVVRRGEVDGVAPIPTVGAYTNIGTATFHDTYQARTWGRLTAAHAYSIGTGRTWPTNGDTKKYGNAYSQAFITAN